MTKSSKIFSIFLGAAGLQIFLFWLIWLFIQSYFLESLTYVDQSVMELVLLLRQDYLNRLFVGLTFFGFEYLLVLGLVVLVYLLVSNYRKLSIFFVLSMFFGSLVVNAVKLLGQRPRPEVASLVSEQTYAFPSGHSANAMIFYGWLIFLVWRQVSNDFLKWFYIGLLSLLIFLVGLSRIYLGVHYPSDVVFGYLLGLSWLFLAIWQYRHF